MEFYYTAFLDLCTCRDVGMGLGPIPWTAVAAYAAYHAVEDFDTFSIIIKKLDSAFLQWQDERRKKDQKNR